MSDKPNQLSRTINFIGKLPASWQSPVLSFVIGRVVRFAGTAGTRIEKLTPTECILHMPNRKKVQNHIGSVHACGIALLAESATGFITGQTVPDNRILVIRSMKVTYLKRATGDMKAVSSFSDEQVQYIKDNEKGEIEVPVIITDATGTQTVDVSMIWAWTPKKKR